MEQKLKLAIVLVLLVILLGFVITGQREIGYSGCAKMLIGLCGLLGLIYWYNRKYK